MRCITACNQDTASLNIKAKMLEIADWKDGGEVLGNPTFTHADMVMVTIDDEHIFHEGLDRELREAGFDFEVMTFITRHKSASQMRSLTVHPVGNYWDAQFGGREGTLPPSAPNWMTPALRALKENGEGLDFAISFEATHHGPYLETPHFFIEIGSTETEWLDDGAGMAIAKTVMGLSKGDDPVAVGVGGGHYMPRVSEVACQFRVAMGHMVPTYQIKGKESGDIENALALAVGSTPGVEMLYLHRKALKGGGMKQAVFEFAEECGLRVVSSSELEPL